MFAYANMTKAFLVIPALPSSSSRSFLVIPAKAGISLHL
jgi:hypothetical protein